MAGSRASDRRYPLQVALGYVLVAGAYIVGSGWLAGLVAGSPAQLQSIERWKGLGFVLVTGFLLYLLCRRFVEQVEREEAAHRCTRDALAAVDRRTVPALVAASLAHDASNAMGAVLGHLDLAAETPEGDPEVRESLSLAQEAARQVVELNRRLAQSARERVSWEPTRFELAEVVDESLALLRHHEKVRAMRIERVPGPPCPVTGSPELVHQIVVNLVVNAAEATEGQGGRVRVREVPEDARVRLDVEDDGPGFAPDYRQWVFEAFQTSKEEGTGIGLFSVKHCAELLGGRVEAGESELGGARVSVWFPCEAE